MSTVLESIEFRAEGAGRVTRWPLTDGIQHIEFTPGNRFSVNGVAMARRLAMLGAGIAVLVGHMLAPRVLDGRYQWPLRAPWRWWRKSPGPQA